MSGYFSLADGRCLPVRDGFVIGRVAPADLVIDDSKASRRHARIVVDNGVVEIEDLGSSNGTLLNGKPVTRRLLRGGDELQIGKTIFTYREGEVPGGGHAKAAAAARPGAVGFDDDNDLFGGDAPAPAPAPRRAEPVPPPTAAPRAEPRPEPVRPVPAAGAPSAAVPPAAPPPPRPAVVEFADEVVEVRKAVAPAAPGKATAAAPAPVASKRQGVLQYSKQAGAGGLLGDDLAQVSGGKRTLLCLGVLLLAVGLGWLVMTLVR